jgi:DNA mismatch repair protein MutS
MSGLDTPMFRQYFAIKAEYPDVILFYRMGDFYELFGEDARWTAAALELTLTSRNKDAAEPVPMCGVPYHAVDSYLRRLLELGKKIAIAEQVEDPRAAKGIVRREVVRVLTPGLAVDGVDAHEPAWLVCAGQVEVLGRSSLALGYLDASTGDLRVVEVKDLDELHAAYSKVDAREVLLCGDVPELPALCVSKIPFAVVDTKRFQARFGRSYAALGVAAQGVVNTLVHYAETHLKSALPHVNRLIVEQAGGTLDIDDATRRNLEVFRPMRGSGRAGTLVGLLDACRTGMGGRLLREWLAAPLLDIAAITARQDAVDAFVQDAGARESVRGLLRGVSDIERIAGRVAQRTASPRDLGALRDTLARLPELTASCAHPVLSGRLPADLGDDLRSDIDFWLVDEPPVASGEGGLLRDGADAEVDRLRGLSFDAKGAISSMESRLKEQTGIHSLKIRNNGVFGYYIEITKSNLDKVPKTWHRKQTIANGERFITPELKEYEEQVSGAEERLLVLEARQFTELRERLALHLPRVLGLARGVAELDVFASFAHLAVEHRYARPVVDDGAEIALVACRHPVVEATRRSGSERFVPNDLRIGQPGGRLVLLTGPNMAGKSTLMRQVALIVLMAQIGCFVPARTARIGRCDRLFVRVGASDDLTRGQSTFMVEMAETANILQRAGPRSLVLLDEVGRGTSTYDGLAIAWAVAEDLHDRVRCRTVFATHYHELAALAESCDDVRNLHVSAAEQGDQLVFLRTLKEGPAPGSYGVQCARQAGLPGPVLARARRLLGQLERKRPKPEATQLSLFGSASPPEEVVAPRTQAPVVHASAVEDALRELDPDMLSPREAQAALYTLKRLLEGG